MTLEPETNRERLLVAEAIYKAKAEVYNYVYTDDIRRHPLWVIQELNELKEVVRLARILAVEA